MNKTQLLLLGIALIMSKPLHAQEATRPTGSSDEIYFKKHPLRYRFSFEPLKMTGEPNLGMVGIGADWFLVPQLPNLYLTLNSYSAVTGNRPGLITFGTGVGYHQPLFNSRLALDAGVYIGGGGGGGAPDGGGLITRQHLSVWYHLNKVGLMAGYSRMDFPTGDMGSNQFHAGISLSSIFHTAHPRQIQNRSNSDEPISGEPSTSTSLTRVSVMGLQYLNFQDGPTDLPRNSERNIGLLGIGIDHFFHDDFYATLKLHGAVTGGVDGYMSYLIGIGYEKPLGRGSWSLDGQLLAGPSGGGQATTGGGGIVQGNVGVRKALGSAYSLKAALGQSVAPEGGFTGTFAEVSLSRSLTFRYPTGETIHYTLQNDDQSHHFSVEILNRTYRSPDALDKSGLPYDEYFNLLGFQIGKKLNKHLSAIGSTYWAYQGSYGAYAEGLVGLRYEYPISPQGWDLRFQGLVGAAGGGGIDLGSGLVFQYSAGISKTLSDTWALSLDGGQMQGLRGNFKPLFLDLGVAYRFSQIEKLLMR